MYFELLIDIEHFISSFFIAVNLNSIIPGCKSRLFTNAVYFCISRAAESIAIEKFNNIFLTNGSFLCELNADFIKEYTYNAST